jgi:rod shape-determining protein MreB
VLIGVPAGITEVERKAVVDAGLNAGARKVFLVEEPMAAAVGAELPISEAKASMILDIGAGTSEVAVVSWGGVVVSKSTSIAGDEFNSTITNYIREQHNVLVGDMSAERLKRKINIVQSDDEQQLTIRGRNLNSGLPKEVVVSRENVRNALLAPVAKVADLVRDIIEETPPELVSDLVPRGLVVSGGGAQLLGIDQYLAQTLEIPVRVADSPDLCVIRGLAKILDDKEFLEKVQVAWGH